jgi:hypothetical protein
VQSVCEPPYEGLAESAGFGSGESYNSASSGAVPTAAGASAPVAAPGPTGSAASTQEGCQVGRGAVDAGDGVWFGLFGLAAFARRRRAQARP